MIGSTHALLRTKNLKKNHLQRHPVTNAKFAVQAFAEVNMTIHAGTTLALVGESGAGKSSLARCLALLERPDKGEIWFEGLELLSLERKALLPIRGQIQIIFQNPTSALNPRLSAAEIIAEPLLIQGRGTKAQQRARALELMDQVGLPPGWKSRTPLEFSGGQRQRLAIARALVLDPILLILDEALSSLDLANQEMILKLLTDLQALHGLTYLHISHDLRLVSQFAEEVAVMHQGRIVEHADVATIFAEPKHPYTQELLMAMPTLQSICQERFA